MLEAALPDALGHQLVHAGRDDVLVMRAVEEGEVAFARHHLVGAPQEVVRPLFLGGHLERLHQGVLDVGEIQDLADGAVLAAGVTPLQDDEQRVLTGVGEQVAQLGEFVAPGLELL